MNKYTNYTEIETADGSTTLHSKIYGESCHSTSGAVSETKTHYLEGCDILAKSRVHKRLSILEVGFGVGIGFDETKKLLQDTPNEFVFVSFEIDLELIQTYANKNQITFEGNKNIYTHTTNNYELIILLGDARETISQVSDVCPDGIHAIYQDAFSPKRNPVLWTTEWFQHLKAFSHKTCLMSTYSASSSIRKSMIAAGWIVYNGVAFGPKRSSTRAKLTGTIDIDLKERLERSPAIEITDDNYKQYKLDSQ